MNAFVLGIIIVILVGERVSCVKIEFFRNENFTDLNYESSSIVKCINIPADKKDVVIKSIKTDICLMVYYHFDCKSFSRKFDLNNSQGWLWPVRSFHTCNEDIGGQQLKIDLTNYYEGTNPTEILNVLQSYRDVCTCINVPQYAQNMSQWSINNYGNDFLAYYQPNCSENKWEAEHIPAGLWCIGSRCMHSYYQIDTDTKTTYKIQSIGPNPSSKYFKTSCEQVPINNQTVDSVGVEILTKKMSDEDLENLQQNFLSLATKSEQFEKQMHTLLTEIEAIKEKTVELESKLENHFRSWEDSLKQLKDDFEIFA